MTICQWVSCLPLTKWELQWDHRSTHVGQRQLWRNSYLANRRKVFLVKSNWQVLVMVIMEEFDSECVWMESRVCKKRVWKAFLTEILFVVDSPWGKDRNLLLIFSYLSIIQIMNYLTCHTYRQRFWRKCCWGLSIRERQVPPVMLNNIETCASIHTRNLQEFPEINHGRDLDHNTAIERNCPLACIWNASVHQQQKPEQFRTLSLRILGSNG